MRSYASVLYFASDRLGGVGYLDIYATGDDTFIAPATLGRIKGAFY
jgi:hypothetical protein